MTAVTSEDLADLAEDVLEELHLLTCRLAQATQTVDRIRDRASWAQDRAKA